MATIVAARRTQRQAVKAAKVAPSAAQIAAVKKAYPKLSGDQIGVAARGLARFGRMPSMGAIQATTARNAAHAASLRKAPKAAHGPRVGPVARPADRMNGMTRAMPTGGSRKGKMPAFVFGRKVL